MTLLDENQLNKVKLKKLLKLLNMDEEKKEEAVVEQEKTNDPDNNKPAPVAPEGSEVKADEAQS